MGDSFPNRKGMSWKSQGRWHSITFSRVCELAQAVGQSLIELGVEPGDKVCIFSPNRPEWTLADLAILGAGAVTVPCFATNTADQTQFVLQHSQSKCFQDALKSG